MRHSRRENDNTADCTAADPMPLRDTLDFRQPTARDARDVNDLIATSPPLDTNSLYCNLIQCTHFADTCLLAEQDGVIKGWVSGHRPANEPSTIFVWQIAVHESARGLGLGLELLKRLLHRPGVAGVSHLKSTVTPSNHASRALFTRFAKEQGLDLDTRPWFDSVVHFGGRHESETLFSIGPLPRTAPSPRDSSN